MEKTREPSGQLLFTIHQVAKILDVVPATIRNWERHKLFIARRGENNYRAYDFDDITFLKRIRELSIDRRLSYSVIQEMLHLPIRERNARSEEPADEQAQDARKLLSEKWRKFREEGGYTLEAVSDAVGISPSYLSKIENGLANISFEILERLAEFYNQNILFFFEEDKPPQKMVPRGTGTPVNIGLPGVYIQNLVAGKDAHLKAMYYDVKPECGNFHDHSHFGEEFLYVLQGQIHFTLNDTEHYRLSAGDSFFFHSNEKHKWINPGDSDAKVLWVYSPFREETKRG
jgi:DNA-binding transcriptional MerR regulator/quercetin dioxygenase-like cupin family protein